MLTWTERATLFSTLAVLCTQHRWCLVPGKISSIAFQKPSAPSPTARSGAISSPWLSEGDAIRLVAVHGAVPEAYAAVRRRGAVFRLSSGLIIARALRTRQTVHVADMRKEQPYLDRDPMAVAGVELGGAADRATGPHHRAERVAGAADGDR